jgi:hypothetical protein
LAELRASLPQAQRQSDPVNYLDQHRPGWRLAIPFDVESEDIRAMVEEIVRLRESTSGALDVTRHLVRRGDGWSPRASLGLSGAVDARRLPPGLDLTSGRRLKVLPIPPFGKESEPVAAIETFMTDAGAVHELRGFVSKFDAPLPLAAEAKLYLQFGNSLVGEFIAAGGEAIIAPIVALQIEAVDEVGKPTSLRVLGNSSIKTNKPHLALAARQELLRSIEFSDGYEDLGACEGTDLRVVTFAGTARFVTTELRYTWRTDYRTDVISRLLLVGNLVREVRESMYRGFPEVWIERHGILAKPQAHAIRWRPRGRGRWRSRTEGQPYGAVDIAIVDDGEILDTASATILPENFYLTVDRRQRTILIGGAEGAVLGVGSPAILSSDDHEGVATVKLGPAGETPTIVVHMRWDAELAFSLADPSFELRLIDDKGAPLPPRPSLSLDDINSLRLVAARDTDIFLELQCSDAPRYTILRRLNGEVPLASFADSIRHLLGSSKQLDARVVIAAVGAADHIAFVRWYTDDVDPFEASGYTPFSELRRMLDRSPTIALRGFSLSHPSSGAIALDAPAPQETLARELERVATGPWLVFGKQAERAKIRPRIIPAVKARATLGEGVVQEAVLIDDPDERTDLLDQAYARPDALGRSDIRTIMDLLLAARKEDLPYASLDVLKALCSAPSLCAKLLAHSDSFGERAALLSLQRDLPFLWPATSVADWIDEFGRRIAEVEKKLEEVGVEKKLAELTLISVLDEIVAVRPELAGHARSVLLHRLAMRGSVANDDRARMLHRSCACNVSTEINAFVCRHVDDEPPLGQFESFAVDRYVSSWGRYGERLSHAIAAPFAVADHACGKLRMSSKDVKTARAAWLYDMRYFESIVPTAVLINARAPLRAGA